MRELSWEKMVDCVCELQSALNRKKREIVKRAKDPDDDKSYLIERIEFIVKQLEDIDVILDA